MNKNRAQKDILYISISSFILVVLWIGFNLYHAYVTSTIAPDLELQIAPIEPRFDTQTLNKLKTRDKIVPLYEIQNASPEAEITPTLPPIQEQVNTNSEEQIPSDSIERLGQ